MFCINSSAIPAVGDCGFFLSSVLPLYSCAFGETVSVFGSFALVGGVRRAFSCGCEVPSALVFALGKPPNASENLDKSFRKLSICSESFIFDISGCTLSAKWGFCER